jgi:hypothetical protein
MDILFIVEEGDISLRCNWLYDLRIHLLPVIAHHHVTNRIELNMPIIVGQSYHFCK